MIESMTISYISLKIEGSEDIKSFVGVIDKLLKMSSTPGYKKQFNRAERDVIYDIAESIGLDFPDLGSIAASPDLVKE